MNAIKTFDPLTGEMKNLLQRLFRMRSRFRVDVPENIEALKKRLFKAHRGNPAEPVGDFTLFYNLGSALSSQAEPLTMGELSRQLNVPLSTATRMVDWTVNNGYARRLPDADDRRVVRVTLTETGADTYREIDAFFQERVEKLLRAFNSDERIQMLKLMEKIVVTMEQEA